MLLAACWLDNRDELIADFRAFYGLDARDFDLDGEGRDAEYAAALVSQLVKYEPGSHLVKARHPESSLSHESQYLRQIEFDIRAFKYGFTEDARKKINQPQPLPLPGQAEQQEEQIGQVFGLENQQAAATALGLTPDQIGGEIGV